MVARLVKKLGVADEVGSSLRLLAVHKPYYEPDHVLNVAYNALCGGRTLDDIELRRRDRVFLDGIGVKSLPDPTTAGDFCRRFDAPSVMALQEAVNRARLGAWAAQPASFFAPPAVIDADASIVPTDGETREGMDISYNGLWGYSALMVSFANTKEPLYFKLSGANRPSHEGVVALYDRSIALCRQAGFTDVLLRGDTDFSLTAEFDRWDDQRRALRFRLRRPGQPGRAGRGHPRGALPELVRPGPAGHQDKRPLQARQRERRRSAGPGATRPCAKRPKTWPSSATGRATAGVTTGWWR